MNISIVVPVFNEEAFVEKSLTSLLNQTYAPKQLVVVDDGSTDQSKKIIRQSIEQNSRIRLVALSRNFGHQNALKAGIDATNADIMIMMDCDMQHPPHLINELLRNYELGYEIVRTHRVDHLSTGFFKTKTSNLFYKILNKLSDIKLEQGSADFRLISGSAITQLKSFSEFDLFYRGLIKWMGYKQISIEYKAEERYTGFTKYTYNKMISFGLKGFTSFSTKPLYFAAYLGFFFASMSIMYIPYIVYTFYVGTDVPGWASVIATIAFFGGVNLMILGIIGVYLSKLFAQSKNRPHYIIKGSNL